MKKEELIQKLRSDYSLIYFWHKRYGLRKFKERWGKESEQGEWTQGYYRLVESLKQPETADVEYIGMIANEVLSGSMEWSYGERIENEIPLNKMAHNIRLTIEEYSKSHENERISESLSEFRNIGTKGETLRPKVISIPLQNDSQWNKETYFRHATAAYHDIPSGENNIGGQIILIETNLEVTQDSRAHYSFFNSKALHLEQIVDKDALVNIAESKSLVIESITLES